MNKSYGERVMSEVALEQFGGGSTDDLPLARGELGMSEQTFTSPKVLRTASAPFPMFARARPPLQKHYTKYLIRKSYTQLAVAMASPANGAASPAREEAPQEAQVNAPRKVLEGVFGK